MQMLKGFLLFSCFFLFAFTGFASTYTITATNSFYCIDHVVGNYQPLTASCDCGGGTSSIEWWDAETGGNLVFTGDSFNPINLGIIPDDIENCYTFFAACACDNGCTGNRQRVHYQVLDCDISPCSEQECTYILVLEDSGYNGWDAASMDISIDEAWPYANYTISTSQHCNGAYRVIPIQVFDNGTIDITYWNGANESEHSFSLFDPNGAIAIDDNGNPVMYTAPPTNQQIRVRTDCTQTCCTPNDAFSFQIEMGQNPASQSWAIYEANPVGGLGDMYLSVNGSTYANFAQGDQVDYSIPLDKCIPYIFVASSASGMGWDGGTWRIGTNDLNYGTPINDFSDSFYGISELLNGPINPTFGLEEQVPFTIPCTSIVDTPQSIIEYLDSYTCTTFGDVTVVEAIKTCFPYSAHAMPTTCIVESIIVQILGDPNNTLTFPGPFSYSNGIGQVTLNNLPVGNHQMIQTLTYCDGIRTNIFSDLTVVSEANPFMDCEDNVIVLLAQPDITDDDNMTGDSHVDDLGECLIRIRPEMLFENPSNDFPCISDEYIVTILDANGNPLIVYDVNGLPLDSNGNSISAGSTTEPAHDIVGPEQASQTLTYVIEHVFSGNICWDAIIIEDKQDPILIANDYDLSCNHPHALDENYTHTSVYTPNMEFPVNIASGAISTVSNTFIPVNMPCGALGEIVQNIEVALDLTHNDIIDLQVFLHAPTMTGLAPILLANNTLVNPNNVWTPSPTSAPALAALIGMPCSVTESISPEDFSTENSANNFPANIGGTWYLQIVDNNATFPTPPFGGGEVLAASVTLTCGFPPPYFAYDCTLDNVALLNEMIMETDCNQSEGYGAKIIRIWQATDDFGRSTTARQTIGLIAPTLNEITVPDHYSTAYIGQFPSDMIPEISGAISFSCHDLLSGTFLDPLCDITYSYNDQVVFTCGNGYKIIRTWNYTNWCTGAVYIHGQTINVYDSPPPSISCPSDLTFCDNTGLSCSEGMASLSITGTNNCPTSSPSNLSFTYYIDENKDGIIDLVGAGDNITDAFPFGNHSIQWIVTDDSGHSNSCQYDFAVEDCSLPNLTCNSGLSIEITPNSCITINALELLNSFSDNCSSNAFIAANAKVRIIGDPAPLESSIQLCPANIGQNFVEVWIEDELGNSNSCTTSIIVSVVDCLTNIQINGNPIQDANYIADQNISCNGIVFSTGNVLFNAGQSICLDPGFEVVTGAIFEAYIEGCPTPIQQNTSEEK